MGKGSDWPSSQASTGGTTLTESTRGSQTLDWSSHYHQRLSEISTGSSRASNYSRRVSDLDDTEKPLESERERSKQQRITSRLECASLRFSIVSVAGREREIAELRSSYGRARGQAAAPNNERGSKELVLIAGASGCGKSRLASTLAERVGKVGGLYVQGKYDLYFRDEPYFGISQACGEIVGHILQLKKNDAEKFAMITNKMTEEIGDELHLLANTIGPIVELVGESSTPPPSTSSSRAELNLEQSKEKFHYAFRKFIRVITDASLFGKPLVMVIDDLQWADTASIELLELLLTDRESSGLMVIGCYRSDEVWEAHILSEAIHDMKQKSHSYQFAITEMNLQPLSIPNVNKILAELLSVDADKALPLAELCHKRCLGNPFHLMEFLRMLEDERFLEFNVGSFRWSFDVEKIEQKTSVTSNIVEMVTARLEQLAAPLQEVLQIAACLGSSFEMDLLRLVWNEMKKGCEAPENGLGIYVEDAIKGHILELDGNSTRVRWVHDKVQEAAMVLGQKDSDCTLQFDVGLVLLQKFSENQLDESAVFVISNLLQGGMLESCNSSKLTPEKREEIAKVNLEAAKKAASCSAFKSAAKYVKNGVALLPEDAFTSNYALALELYSIGVEVEGCIGNDVEMEAYCGEVMYHSRDVLDKIRAYNMQLSRLGNTKKTRVACKLCMDILEELGCFTISRNSLSQKVTAVVALKRVKDVDQEFLDTLPLMTDPTQLATMSILKQLAMYAHHCGDKFLLILASCGMYEMSLKHGLCPLSTSAFTALAVVRTALGNFEGAKSFADQALSLLPRFESKSDVSRTYFISYFMVKLWTMPFSTSLKYLQESYRIGLECGDTESGSWGIAMYIVASFLGGSNLNSVLSDIRAYLPQVKDLGRDEQALHITLYFQACLCFMGQSKSPTEMSGEAIPNAGELEKELRSIESKSAHVVFQVHQSYLLTIFGEHAKCAKLALERGNTMFRTSSGAPPSMLDAFVRGISLYEMARQTKKMKYKRAAKKTLATTRKWAKAGNPNVVHKLAILEAEQYALKGKRDAASEAYGRSITQSIRCGAVQDAALACERYGEYLLNEVKDKEKAIHFLEKAVGYYEDWGAAAKVRQLNERYSSLWTVPCKIEIK